MEKEERGRGHGTPLRRSLVLLFLLCWMLPVLLLIGVTGWFTQQATTQRVTEVITASVENTMDNLCRDLDSAVNGALGISYVPTIRLAYARYQQDGNTVALYNTARKFLQQQFARSQEVCATYLLFPEDERPEPDLCYDYNPRLYQASQALVFYTSGAQEKALSMMDTLDTDMAFFTWQGRLYLVRNLSLRDNRFDPYALLAQEVYTPNLYASLQNLPLEAGASLRLDGMDLPLEAGDADALWQLEDGHRPQTGELVLQESLGRERYTLAYTVAVDIRPMMAETGSPLVLMVVIALLSAPLMLPVLYFLFRWVNRPIQALSQLAGRIEEGELGAQTDISGFHSREFRYLGEQMNDMSVRLEDQFERLYREELALRDARIKALQSQINPHFLGNTLETINWEARLSGNEKVSQMLEALSTVLRAGMDRDQRPLVHLSEEMIYINAYLTIIHQRLGQRLTIQKNISDELLNWYVPRLILQPIVENAVEHGVENRPSGLLIIRARRLDENWMSLEVENDAPLSTKDEANIRRLLADAQDAAGTGNIGIRNVHQRLRMLYGEQGGLSIKTDKNLHTISSMRIQNRQESQVNAT